MFRPEGKVLFLSSLILLTACSGPGNDNVIAARVEDETAASRLNGKITNYSEDSGVPDQVWREFAQAGFYARLYDPFDQQINGCNLTFVLRDNRETFLLDDHCKKRNDGTILPIEAVEIINPWVPVTRFKVTQDKSFPDRSTGCLRCLT